MFSVHTCSQIRNVCSLRFHCSISRVLFSQKCSQSQMQCKPPGGERRVRTKGSKSETRVFPVWGCKLSYCFFLCCYSREVAVILPSRLVSHAWVITCGWEWSVLFLPLHPQLGSQLRYSSIRADNKSCDGPVPFLNCCDNLLLTGKALFSSRNTFFKVIP